MPGTPKPFVESNSAIRCVRNARGAVRKAGFELEYNGVTIARSAELVREVFGGGDEVVASTFARDVLGYRLYERIELDDGTETGAWLSLSIAAHELIYVADAHGANGRLHHLASWVDTREECLRAADVFVDADVPIEAAPSKHGVAQGFFLYGFEPGGNRIEVTTGGYFVYDPDFEPITWTAAERARGQYWGVQTIESFHTYGTPDVAGGG